MNKKFRLPIVCLFLSLIGLFLPSWTHAQISEGGTPVSFQYPDIQLKSTQPIVQIPIHFSVEDLIMVDRWQVSQGAPLKVGTLIDTDLTIDNSGTWSTLPDGNKIWKLQIQAKDAIALMLSFNDFYIPEKGRLFIYNADKTQLIGAFTHRTNPTTKEYATEFLAGDELVLEYEANGANELPRLSIDAIGYGYNHLHISRTKAQTGPGTSGSCMVNINCEEGDAWQNEKNGVCQMTLPIGNYIYICSGALVNNTAEDLKPYILSAYHCIDLNVPVTQEDLNKYVFYFHFEHTDCENSSPIASYKTITGCTKVAEIPLEKGSDGLLLLLNQMIPESYDVYYNGWDRSNTPAQSGAGLHHPSGDYMKISIFDQKATSSTWYGTDKKNGATNAHWNVLFKETPNGHGVTEGGSSGSPLFNQNKLIVGTLSGGSSSCEEPNGLNLYGKLSYHWDQYSTDKSKRMDFHLDPKGTGATRLDGRYAQPHKPAPSQLTLTYKNGEVQLSWKAPASTTEKPEQYTIYRNNTFLGQTTGTTYTDDDPKTGTQFYSVSAQYADGKESKTVSASIYVYELKVPTDVIATRQDNDITVSWKEPIYQQTIYWGTGSSYLKLGFGQPFYFGQKWDPEDLAPLHKNVIDSVLFLPIGNIAYSLLIKQGNRSYTQRLSGLTPEKINVVGVKTPYPIDASKELIIAFHADPDSKDDYPAVTDKGPAVNGKGNLVSTDGENWEYLYEPSEKEDENYDFNFLMAAIVSSRQQDIPLTKATASESKVILNKSSVTSVRTQKAESAPSLRSAQATAFPNITGYNIYRNESKVGTVSDKSVTQFTDKQVPTDRLTYRVSALYRNDESKKSEASQEISVANEQITLSETGITPTSFTSQVQLTGYEKINLLEIISSDGKTVLKQKAPEATVYTSSLAPGIYFFRLHTDRGVKVIKGIKTSL